MMKLVFATHNKNKWREVQSMLPEEIQDNYTGGT